MEHGADMQVIAVITASIIGWVLVSERLERRNITAPMVLGLVGLLVANQPIEWIDLNASASGVRGVAELTLAVVLFGGAARLDLRKLRADAALPARLLLIGLPLTLGASILATRLVYPGISLWLCAAIGSMVTPTDAALSKPIVEDERIPEPLREGLNVESGLNDGIATPFVTFFLVGAAGGVALDATGPAAAIVDMVLGSGIGIAVGIVGAVLLRLATARGWTGKYASVAVALLGVLAYAVAVDAGGNGFVAAFVAGLAFTVVRQPDLEEELEFTDRAGELLSYIVWFLFGAVVLPILGEATWRDALFALLALTVLRMVPVAIALIGSERDLRTVLLLGWFGPRGLASVVFGLLAYDTLSGPSGVTAGAAVTATVLGSVVLHGITAAPMARRYARRP